MPAIRIMTAAWMAALLVLPFSRPLAATKSKAEIASEKAAADLQAARDKAFDAWQETQQWREVAQEELAMTSEPRAPGAFAVHLYTETQRNNVHNGEMNYWQTKILSEEGRNLANISINYDQQSEVIRRIDARVIQPDGAAVTFSGEIYDRPLNSGGNSSLRVKSFTLPEVRVGSIVEVRYWRRWQSSAPSQVVRTITVDSGTSYSLVYRQGTVAAPAPRWILNQRLHTRLARYSLQLLGGQFVRWSLPTVLPAGASEPKSDGKGLVTMEARNMPEFVAEDYMPPADDLAASVDFGYDRLAAADVGSRAAYWKTFGVNHSKSIETFLGKPKFVSRRLAKIIDRTDSTEQKYQKIYERVRRMGNLDIPGALDEQERQRCSKPREHVWEVAEAGCGNTAQLQLYFVALCRAAGLPAAPVRISSRQRRFFTPETPDSSRLDGWLVAITLNGREVMLSPGVPFLPFGSLIWWDTAVPAFRPEATGGSWSTTPVPVPADAVTRRTAKLALSDDGVLEGTVVLRHSGHEATVRMTALLLADEQTRLDALKDDLRYALAVPADITVTRQPDWRSADSVLETEYRVRIQQWAVTSGRRLLVGVGLFGHEQLGKFVAPRREHPIYFQFPFLAEDEVELTLPAGYRLQNAPARQVSPDNALKYVTSVEARDGVVRIRRSLSHNLLLAKQNQYPRVKSFYELVRSGDQEQLVLER